ncbi:NAD(P) transhydrogenase subunit alpha (plasmid) [Rhizobium tumorigenes]|uniref:proton-translocating NAD(P)(+) transhydrogenase n=2 Tax=Rhizobium tumorigenes TaxID=2041385 RepID=A0AAF1KA29_9HYPH|nr:NAD(P) transhydrogenase subunit alpha [Rhizobium tumorigenes]WFR99157.1 NAD(P) transhydrogenase subunit alpha [Rhizobium tumorigenes]
MLMKIAVLKETRAGEKRVALAPAVTGKLVKLGAELHMQSGAGDAAKLPDTSFQQVAFEPDQKVLLGDADIVLCVQAPAIATVKMMKPGAILICLVYANREQQLVKALCEDKITTFAMETVPRISRAQSIDVLSTQSALSGYYAPLLGAANMPRILPMMTTAVGSLRAAKVLVMGLGVAGLQALATAHRLGAITEGYDVRPETKEQALSVGAKFVETGVDARGEGGYARELTAEEKLKVNAALTQHIQEADLIITTAAVPGRPSPKLIDAQQLAGMKPGSVIVDLGAEGGGNCVGTKPGETVEIGPVTILAPLNVPSHLAQHASELYAKNLLNLLQLIVRDGKVVLDFEDEVIAKTVLTHEGEMRNQPVPSVVQLKTPEGAAV